MLALFTDGLIESRDRDIDLGIAELHRALALPARPLEDACDDVLDSLLADAPADDVALLLARTRALPPDHVATWDMPADPAAVARVRKLRRPSSSTPGDWRRRRSSPSWWPASWSPTPSGTAPARSGCG